MRGVYITGCVVGKRMRVTNQLVILLLTRLGVGTLRQGAVP